MAVIALNTQYSPNRGKVFGCTVEDYDRVIREPWLAKAIDKIRGGNETEKGRLPFMCPHFSEFKDNRRAQSCIIPEAFTWHTMVDIDDKEKVEGACEAALRLNMDEASVWYHKLKLASYSARKKLHLFIEMPLGMTIHEAQVAYCKAIGTEADSDCETPERMIYLTDVRQEIYRSDDFLKPFSEEEIKERMEAMKGRSPFKRPETPATPNPPLPHIRRLSISDFPSPVEGEGNSNNPSNNSSQAGEGNFLPSPFMGEGCPQGGKGVALAGNLIAFDLCVSHAGLDPEHLDVWGEHNWHANLMAVLSAGLTKLMPREQLMAVVAEKLPNYSQTEDCKKLIDYFYDNYQADKGFMSAALREINAKAQYMARQEMSEDDKEMAELMEGWDAPKLPDNLPPLIRMLVTNYDKRFREMLCLSSLPVLSALASHFRAQYLNGRIIGPQMYVAVIGGSGSGKGNCTNLYKDMVEDNLARHDAEEWEKVKKNQEERDQKANAKDKPKKYHPKLRLFETASKSSILELQTNLGKNGMLLGQFSEVDGLSNAAKNTYSDLSVLLRKGWDMDMHRQFYLSESTCNTYTQMSISLLMCGTVKAMLERLFSENNRESGLMQRCISVLVPTEKRSFRPPKQNFLTAEERVRNNECLNELYNRDIELGDEVKVLDLPLTTKVIGEWFDELEERYNDGLLTDAEADLSHRCGEFMMRAAIPLVAYYGEETREIVNFARWVGEYAHYTMCRLYGCSVQKNIENAHDLIKQSVDGRKTVEPILAQLPDVFTLREFKEVRAKNGQSTNVKVILWRYKKNGIIEYVGKQRYRKVKK